MMTRLLHPKNIMVEAPIQKGKYISLMNVLQGDLEAGEVKREAMNWSEIELRRHTCIYFLDCMDSMLEFERSLEFRLKMLTI